ncbi:MAG: DUF2254 domain-containing protein [Treponema sp.]|nr:DUF2254 domain-containing protein [Treponema sp.]
MKLKMTETIRKVVIGLIVVNLASVVFAQNLTITDENSTKETKIILNAVKGKSTEIYRITGQSTSTSISSGYSISSAYTNTGQYAGSVQGSSIGSTSTSGMSYQFVCTTPNELHLDSGQMQLKTAGNAIFTISATGGTQIWNIKAGSVGLYGTGMTFEILGASALLTGILLAILPQGFDDSWGTVADYSSNKALYSAGVGLSIAGSIMTVAGIPMMVAGKSKATLLRIEF